MKLIDQIRKDRIVAFKAKENIKKNLLGCLIADACKDIKEPDDIKVLSMIKKFIEGAELVKENSKDGDYEYFQADIEIEILKEYRPKQLTKEEIKQIIYEVSVGAGHGAAPVELTLGNWMKYFKDNYLNQYDAALVSKIVREMIV